MSTRVVYHVPKRKQADLISVRRPVLEVQTSQIDGALPRAGALSDAEAV